MEKVAFGQIDIHQTDVVEILKRKQAASGVVIVKTNAGIACITPVDWKDDALYQKCAIWAIHVQPEKPETNTGHPSTWGESEITYSVTTLYGIGLSFTEVKVKIKDMVKVHLSESITFDRGQKKLKVDLIKQAAVKAYRDFVVDKLKDDYTTIIFTTMDPRFRDPKAMPKTTDDKHVTYVAVLIENVVNDVEGPLGGDIQYTYWDHLVSRYGIKHIGMGDNMIEAINELHQKVIDAYEDELWEPEGPFGNDSAFASVSPNGDKNVI